MITALLVIVCGGLGAVVRFAVDSLVQRGRAGEFPLGTLIVNVSGSVLLGLLVGLHPSSAETTVLGTATLGSYTTFSTWMLESHRPAQDGEAGLAWQNIGIGLVCGFGAIVLGRAVGGLL